MFLVACVVLLSISQPEKSDASGGEVMAAYIPALMSVLAGFLFGIRIVFIKYDGMALSV